MLDSVLEFITQAASSSAFIFCFCNLIIVIILVDLKPSLSIHQESEIPLSKGANQKQGSNSKPLVEKDTTSLPQEVEVSHDQEAEADESIEIEGNDDCSNEEEEKVEGGDKVNNNYDDDDDNNDNDDELKRRVEEFIEKVNKGWKEELLSTSSMV
ncbi:chromatin modification-related protein EAF7 [Cajanus cajan]|uniref:Uncharacterized protein n=1 Tax=Cajanus cajan TaxID=3821 RepID=A0A151S418_CAJCA|nr:chromatin modification-related protein EAF7 [Cajanus cajan]KYP49481.1 hypothetical protein KK1_028762 [Cajanus cajan]KYP61853.1 hypothetical protein KK1_016365 [Cajanus cajan]